MTRTPNLVVDDQCLSCGRDLADHPDCYLDGLVCEPCPHPACHEVRARKVPGPLNRLQAVCVQCGPLGPTTDTDGVRETRALHHREVTQ